MDILLDSANLAKIAQAMELYPLSGVTTNPTLISREKQDFWSLIGGIQEIIGKEKMLHVQIISTEYENIVNEAAKLRDKLGGNLLIKIPVTSAGIRAIKELSKTSFKITATAVFTAMQALMAAKAGAAYVAPYVNRLDNLSADGVGTVVDIVKIFKDYNMTTKVIAASFNNVEQIHRTSLAGAHAVTVSPDLLERIIYHPMTDLSVEQFVKDWENVYGKGNTISNQ
jgi:fructose-6-phosphate aldolase 2